MLEKARAKARALLAGVPQAIIAGAALGFVLGGTLLVAGLAHDATTGAKVVRIAEKAGRDASDAGFMALASANPAAMVVAMRYDPAVLTAGQPANPMRSLTRISNPAARPWTASPLDAASQLDCLTQAVYYEARGETPAGQAAVAQVVLNRVRHPSFPQSICGVVFQGAQNGRGCQFSFACNGAMRGRREGGAWDRAETVARRALNGHVMAEVGNATHFHVTSVQPNWRNLMRVAQVGVHVFYRFGGKSGAPTAFAATPEPEAAPEAMPILASLTVEPAQADAGSVVDAVMRTETPAAAGAPAAPVKAETAKPAPKPEEAKPAAPATLKPEAATT